MKPYLITNILSVTGWVFAYSILQPKRFEKSRIKCSADNQSSCITKVLSNDKFCSVALLIEPIACIINVCILSCIHLRWNPLSELRCRASGHRYVKVHWVKSFDIRNVRLWNIWKPSKVYAPANISYWTNYASKRWNRRGNPWGKLL